MEKAPFSRSTNPCDTQTRVAMPQKAWLGAAIIGGTMAMTSLPQAAQADSFMGFRGTEVELGFATIGDQTMSYTNANIDVAFTDWHGIQLDLGTVSHSDHWQGQFGAHLYLNVTENAKYGFFFAYHDLDDSAAYSISGGVEGMWQLGPRTILEGRAGFGIHNPNNRDFLFAELSADYMLSDRWTLKGGISLLDLEEPGVRAQDITVSLGARYTMKSAPLAVDFAVNHTFADDHLGSPDQTGVSLALVWTPWKGSSVDSGVRAKSFSPIKPLDGLFARGVLTRNDQP